MLSSFTPAAVHSQRTSRSLGWLALLAFALSGCETHGEHGEERFPEGRSYEREIVIVPRTPHIATFPCGELCHNQREPNPTRRALALFHAGRELEHGPAIHWCERCHSLEQPDNLALFDGTLVSFDQSDLVCAQCHGEKHRDWSRGLHGLQTGGWMGVTQRRLCTACHDPHTPDRFEIEALPPPTIRGVD